MRCPGVHCDGCGKSDAAGFVAAGVTVAAVAGFFMWLVSVIWIVVAFTVPAVVVFALVLVWMYKAGRPPKVMPWYQVRAVQAPRARAVTARPARAIPAPRIVQGVAEQVRQELPTVRSPHHRTGRSHVGD